MGSGPEDSRLRRLRQHGDARDDRLRKLAHFYDDVVAFAVVAAVARGAAGAAAGGVRECVQASGGRAAQVVRGGGSECSDGGDQEGEERGG